MVTAALKSFRPSLRLSLACLLVALAAVTATALGLAVYASARRSVFEGIRDRLRDAVAVGSLLVDADAHSQVRSRTDEDGPEYKAVQAVLRQIRDQCPDLHFVYTLRQTAAGQFAFFVDAEEDPDEFSHVGHLYDGEPCEAMRAAFTPPYQPQVDTRLVTDAWGVFLTSYAPLLTSSGEFEGVLAMDMSAASIRRYERRCLLSIAAITLGVSLLAIALAVVLSHRVTRPLLLLAQDMDAVQRFQLDRQLPVRSRIREIDDMAHAVRAMKAGLLSFRRYVPADLVSELIRLRQDAVLGGERRQITTLFSDIRGFTAISERLPPEVLAGSLSAYFRTMTRTIVEHRGTVDKFVGDAIMAFWGAPAPVEDHALLACRAALACQRHLLSLNQEWRRQGLPALETRIGISTGEAIVGNIGYEERLSYTALGDSVNVASRAEGLNRHYGSRIVITEYTLRLVQDHVLARWLDRVAVKGRSEAVDIHELLAERDAATPEQVRFAEAVGQARGRYLRREWQAALEAFAAARALAPGDEATGLLAERCRAFLATPPPAAWDGATVMSEK